MIFNKFGVKIFCVKGKWKQNIQLYEFYLSKGNKTIPGNVAKTHTEDGHKGDTKTGAII